MALQSLVGKRGPGNYLSNPGENQWLMSFYPTAKVLAYPGGENYVNGCLPGGQLGACFGSAKALHTSTCFGSAHLLLRVCPKVVTRGMWKDSVPRILTKVVPKRQLTLGGKP